MYIYEGHMGWLYTSDTYLGYKDLYCEQCGDSDWLVGYATTRAEAWALLKDKTDMFDISMCEGCQHADDDDYCESECENFAHNGGWDYDYVQQFINENWNE